MDVGWREWVRGAEGSEKRKYGRYVKLKGNLKKLKKKTDTFSVSVYFLTREKKKRGEY